MGMLTALKVRKRSACLASRKAARSRLSAETATRKPSNAVSVVSTFHCSVPLDPLTNTNPRNSVTTLDNFLLNFNALLTCFALERLFIRSYTIEKAEIYHTMKSPRSPAMVPAPAVSIGAPAITGVVMCAVSFVASAQPLRIDLPKISLPEMPKISLPELKMPEVNIDLPGFGKKKEATPRKKVATPAAPTAGQVKVRAAKGVVPTASDADAPTLAEITGQVSSDTIKAGAGYKKFPERRMPGANMDGWKQIAKDIAPKV